MEEKKVQIEDSWYRALTGEFDKPCFGELTGFIRERKKAGAVIYPPGKQIFRAFDSTPLSEVKVVILGQDPYHGPGEAMGLCFSVARGVRIPPSLRNIFRELHEDTGLPIPDHGDLSAWTGQGVFLLNALLTVEHKSPASHKGKGWESFTDEVIRTVSRECQNVVFILWGAYARSKSVLIDAEKHLILEAPHPAAEVYAGGKAGFFGSRPFSKANEYLESNGKSAVDWNLPKDVP